MKQQTIWQATDTILRVFSLSVLTLIAGLMITSLVFDHRSEEISERLTTISHAAYGEDYSFFSTNCSSNSMGLTIRCGDDSIARKLKKNETLHPGQIYVYNLNGTLVVHRLVYCFDQQCNPGIFKGDYNLKAEAVPRQLVEYEIEGVSYFELEQDILD